MFIAMERYPNIIAGGGIAGLAAALGLARIGQPSLILEQARSIETVGAGLQIGPHAVKALQWLGAWEELAPRCVAPEAIEIRDAMSGALLQRIPLDKGFEQRFGAPYRVAHRADLLDALMRAASATPLDSLRTAARVRTYSQQASGIDVQLEDGENLFTTCLIGADGIRSAVRARMLADGPPTYRGQALYRALVPAERLPSALAGNNVCLWLGRGFHLVHYPVSGGDDLNLVLSVDSSWTSDRWSEPASPGEVDKAVDGASAELLRIVALPGQWLKWAGADRRETPGWHEGRVVLIGDAAHATLPYLAQGAAMSLEDAVLLARHFGRLDAYAAARIQRTSRVQSESRAMAGIYHAAGIKRAARNLVIHATGPSRFLDRLSWLYAYDPVTA
jgi:salicylate hydroxylase